MWPRMALPRRAPIISVRWQEVAIDRGRLTSVSRAERATVDDDGVYRLCSIPSGSAIEWKAELMEAILWRRK